MLVLTCSSKLSTLRRILTYSFPESVKVCGALQYVINKNPFRLQVLVDQWPDFTSVLCRPPLERLEEVVMAVQMEEMGNVNDYSEMSPEMTDPSDHYTNTYFLFSKDPQGLYQFLQDPQTVNWKQNLQIQGGQPALAGVLKEVSSKHGSQMHITSNLLYMSDGLESEDLEKVGKLSVFQFSSLKPEEAHLVNGVWAHGGNPQSERYISRCIHSFPSVCARKFGVEKPVAWLVSEQSAEIRMGYTDTAYRNQGLCRAMIIHLTNKLRSKGCPLYGSVAPDNKSSQAAVLGAGSLMVGRGQKWTFHPL